MTKTLVAFVGGTMSEETKKRLEKALEEANRKIGELTYELETERRKLKHIQERVEFMLEYEKDGWVGIGMTTSASNDCLQRWTAYKNVEKFLRGAK